MGTTDVERDFSLNPLEKNTNLTEKLHRDYSCKLRAPERRKRIFHELD